MRIAPVTLKGRHVRLEPSAAVPAAELTRAMLTAPEIFKHMPFRIQSAADVAAYLARWDEPQRSGHALLLVTRLCETGEIAGGSSFRLIDAGAPSVEIGATWILPEWQRSFVNTEAKWLQLRHCFEVLGCSRVEFKTDIFNVRSRAALARLGAKQEGVWRSHMRRVDGSVRDSVMFSIIADEWPQVCARLAARLEQSHRLESAAG